MLDADEDGIVLLVGEVVLELAVGVLETFAIEDEVAAAAFMTHWPF